MRQKRGKRTKSKTLDPIVGDDGESRGVTGKEGKGFFACYILTSLSPRHKGHTYIGFTVNPKRRIRQHNGEITSGAVRTKKKRPWEMVLCIYGFPTNIAALQFEWAWQHPRESLAVREAALAFKSFTGLASKIKLAYTMLNLPSWNTLNLTVNYFSSKYAHHGGVSPSLPTHMKVQVCAMEDLPCFAKLDKSSQSEDDECPEVDEEKEENDISSSSQSSSSEKELHEKAREPETLFEDRLDESEEDEVVTVEVTKKATVAVFEDRLANFSGFGLLDESDEDEVVTIEATKKATEAVLEDRLASFSGFGLLDEEDEVVEVSHRKSTEAVEKDCWRRSDFVISTTHEAEVIDLLTPSPSCRDGSSMKRRRVSDFVDLTKSPSFIEL